MSVCSGEKENSLKTDDYGRDLSSVQTLLTKQVGSPQSLRFSFCVTPDLWLRPLQETFDAGLQAFQQEGITNITALKDQLLAAQHVQSKAIEARHAALIKRWNQLLSNSAARKKKLLEAQDHFRKVEDLFLTFAKKASAFNSWFENAEEDLTDPVRCNSLEEIRALREAHEAFRSSLSSAQTDFNQLAELDQQIKSYQVASNPYTWFTMEALEETWRNLQKIIKVRIEPLAPVEPGRPGVTVLVLSAGERAGAAEGTEEAGGERQAAAGVRSTRQRLPPVAAGDQVGPVPVQTKTLDRLGSGSGDMF